jgi:hypothetical protein
MLCDRECDAGRQILVHNLVHAKITIGSNWFSERVWESSFMANSGFYTNRIHYEELLQLFRRAGFEPEIIRTSRWTTLPLPRRKMATEFAALPDEDLQVSNVDVLLH